MYLKEAEYYTASLTFEVNVSYVFNTHLPCPTGRQTPTTIDKHALKQMLSVKNGINLLTSFPTLECDTNYFYGETHEESCSVFSCPGFLFGTLAHCGYKNSMFTWKAVLE